MKMYSVVLGEMSQRRKVGRLGKGAETIISLEWIKMGSKSLEKAGLVAYYYPKMM